MRAAITIIYDGLHHLKHKGFTNFMVNNFDHWIVIEGLASNGGSTYWCNNLDLPPRSTDGTHELLTELASQHKNITYYSPNKKWVSKDRMISEGVKRVPFDECFLWQVDVDEHWTAHDIRRVEHQLEASRCNVASAQLWHHVKTYIARGHWGSAYHKRVWLWSKGMNFKSHEPPKMSGETRQTLRVPEKFHHYSYTFEQDVKFKAKYYKGYEAILEKWRNLPDRDILPISALFHRRHPLGKTATKLVRYV